MSAKDSRWLAFAKRVALGACFFSLLGADCCSGDDCSDSCLIGSTRQCDPCPHVVQRQTSVCQQDGKTWSECVCPSESLLSIQVTGITMAPFKGDGTEWDTTNVIPSDLISGLATALGAAEPYAAVIAYLGTEAVKPLSKPDAYGTMELWVNGRWSPPAALATREAPVHDAFVASWPAPPAPGWYDVPLQESLRLRLHILDSDLLYDDPIGDAEINYADIQAALAAQKIIQVDVSGQTQKQLLFVALSVSQQ